MQRIVLRHEDERTALDSGASPERRRVTLVFPASVTEYEQARVEMEIQTSTRPSDETTRGGRDKNGCMAPAPSDGAGTADGARYIVTTDEQRRAWDLPDLANTPIAHDTAPGDPDTIESRDVVPVVDPTEAIDLLLENDDGSDDGATANDTVNESGGSSLGRHRCGRTFPAPVVNLKDNRGPIPEHIRATFRELCRQPSIDGLLESIDRVIATLEGSVVPDLEAARLEVAALRRREVTPQRLGDAGGAGLEEEQADRIARTCWTIERRLEKVDEALERLSFSGMKISPTPSAFRRLLREAEVDPAEATPPEGLFAACDKALRGYEQAAAQAVGRIRAVAEARREVAPGEWNDAALSQIRHLARLIEDVWAVLDNDSLPKDEVKAVRESLKALEDERQSADRLAAATLEVLGQLEAADLPLPVLARALDEIRMSQTAGREAAGVLLERLRVVADMPWAARAAERDRHRGGDGGAGSGLRRPAGDQGAHPPVPGHTPVDVDDVDPGGSRPRHPGLPREELGAARAAPPRRAPGPARHPGPDPVLRRAGRLRPDVAGQAARPCPAPPRGDRGPGRRLGRVGHPRSADQLPVARGGPDRSRASGSQGPQPRHDLVRDDVFTAWAEPDAASGGASRLHVRPAAAKAAATAPRRRVATTEAVRPGPNQPRRRRTPAAASTAAMARTAGAGSTGTGTWSPATTRCPVPSTSR